MIMLLILTTPLLLTLIKMKTKKPNNLFNLLSENYLNIWGIFCQQGLPGKDSQILVRIIINYNKNFFLS